MSKRRRSQHRFSMVPRAQLPRSVFSRSHSYKSMFDGSFLIPIYVDEALPGDSFRLKMSAFARLASPLEYPILDSATLDFFFFAVPNRLLWSNWEKFQGAQDDPGDSIDFTIPQVSTVGSFSEFSIFDYFGLPCGKSGSSASALPLRAYNLIWNEWFRDQNLQDSISVPLTDGPDSTSIYSLRKRGKRHDYFTSCLPWPQKGAAIDLPLGTSADVVRETATSLIGVEYDDVAVPKQSTLGNFGDNVDINFPSGNADANSLQWGTDVGLMADLTTATAATINSIREAFQLQKLAERDARGGTRYVEIIKSHFGVTSPDFRLQRPEYLGGGSAPLIVNPVAQTGETGTTPQGWLTGFGTVSASGIGFSKAFTEHCTLIGLVAARADLTYQQGMNRMWRRSTRYDFYMPALAHLGEQAVQNGEIYFQGSDHLEGGVPEDTLTFGYQERWAEYKYYPSLITGKLNSTRTGDIDEWHLAEEFSTIPLLDSTFIQDNSPFDRVISVPTEPQFVFDSYFEIQAARPMPVYSVPGFIDHF